MPLYNFSCPDCGDVSEHLTKMDVITIKCDCGGFMTRQISAPRLKLDGTNPDFPGAYEKWGRDREKRAKQAKKKSYYEG